MGVLDIEDTLGRQPGIAVKNGNGNGNGWKKYVTFDRVLLVAILLFKGGGFWQGQQSIVDAVTDKLRSLETRVSADESIYERKDVLDPTLQSIEQQLSDIKDWMRAKSDKSRP